MRTAKVIADRVISTRGMPAATGIAATNKTDSFAARASFEARAAFCVKRIHLRRAYRSQTAHKVEGPKRRGRGHGKTWKRPVAALLLCALLAGAGSLAAAPYAGESGELTPQERARRANVPEGPWIWIDIPQKSLTLYEGTEVKKRYAVATGTGDTPSPIGTFRVTSRLRAIWEASARGFGAERPVGAIWHPWHQQARQHRQQRFAWLYPHVCA